MASELRATFELEIGELVFFKGAQHTCRSRPIQFCITEQLAQVCHGGVQKLYRLSGKDDWHPEIALTRDEPAYRPVSVEEREDELRDAYTRWIGKPKAEPEQTGTQE